MLEAYKSNTYDLFVYTEDDIVLTDTNVLHWLEYNAEMEAIGAENFFPSFARIEYSSRLEDWCLTEIMSPLSTATHPCIFLPRYGNQIALFSLTDAHQAMFIYNRRHMEEYIHSEKFLLEKCAPLQNINHPTWGGGGVCEASALGISLHNIPTPFHSRNLLPVFLNTGLPHPAFLVHHATDRFANDPGHLKSNQIMQKL